MAPIVMGLAAVAGAFLSYRAAREQKQAGDKAQELANVNAALIKKETAEQAKRMAEDQRVKAGQRRASAAAGGIGGATQTAFLAAADRQEAEDLKYFKEAGKSRAQIASAEGTIAKKTARAGAMGSYATAVGSLGSAAGSFAKAGGGGGGGGGGGMGIG